MLDAKEKAKLSERILQMKMGLENVRTLIILGTPSAQIPLTLGGVQRGITQLIADIERDFRD